MNQSHIVLAPRRFDPFVRFVLFCGYSAFLLCGCVSQPTAQLPPTPAEIYGELFHDVQTQAVFSDSKTFVDALPKRSPQEILDDYRENKDNETFDLRAFVVKEFTTATAPDTA